MAEHLEKGWAPGEDPNKGARAEAVLHAEFIACVVALLPEHLRLLCGDCGEWMKVAVGDGRLVPVVGGGQHEWCVHRSLKTNKTAYAAACREARSVGGTPASAQAKSSTILLTHAIRNANTLHMHPAPLWSWKRDMLEFKN